MIETYELTKRFGDLTAVDDLNARDAIIMVYPGFQAMMTAGMGMGVPAGSLEYDIGLCSAAMAAYLIVGFFLSMFFTRRREML